MEITTNRCTYCRDGTNSEVAKMAEFHCVIFITIFTFQCPFHSPNSLYQKDE